MDVINKVIYNLGTIGRIGSGQRIVTTKEFIAVEEESMLQCYYRWQAGESRDKAVVSICREIDTAVCMSQLLMESRYVVACATSATDTERKSRVELLAKLMAAITDANRGIINLCATYATDANVCGKLAPLTESIPTHAAAISAFLLG